MNKLIKRIIINPEIMAGKPIIKGTRLTVSHILENLAQGMSIDELFREYPNLTLEDIHACFAFAKEALKY